MRHIALAHATDFDGWRTAARALLADDFAPELVEWTAGTDAPGMFAGEPPSAAPAAGARPPAFKVPRAFLDLCATVILHSDPERFALLYRLLWRLRDERALLSVAVDPDVARAEAMVKGVHRDMHKMKAFVRFREIDADGPLYIAWFEPAHHIVAATASFFARRFATRRWSILTPELSVHWDGDHLTFGPGARREDAPDADRLEALWRTYYASIFNPARLKVSAMQAEMPKKYWRNLPEATLITPLIAAAQQRTQQMLDEQPTAPRKPAMSRAAAKMPAPPKRSAPAGSFEEAREAAAGCRDCPLWKPATQTVFGEGNERAAIMIVGEQPGDKEDLEGRPFVGPAGKMFDRALQEVGIERGDLYVTNAVKHFKFEPRGKRRLHKKPVDAEIDACYQWLDRELHLVQPKLIVAMGATAARALLRRATPIEANRGKLTDYAPDTKLLITVHPSYLLRVPDEIRQQEYERFVADLKLAIPFLTRRGSSK